jgi:hypothetical protein
MLLLRKLNTNTKKNKCFDNGLNQLNNTNDHCKGN